MKRDYNNEKMLIKKMYDGVYSDKAREIGWKIRCDVFGSDQNIGQNCILSRSDIDKSLNEVRIKKENKILDIGCGDGGIDLYLAGNYGVSVVGVDFSSVGIEKAKEKARSANLSSKCIFHEGSAEDIVYKDNYFDLVLSYDFFIHIYNKPAVLKEIFRVLKPGGKFVFYDWIDLNGVPDKVQKSGKLWGYIYVSKRKEFKELIESNGFKVKTIKDNSENFKKIISKWEKVNLSYKHFLIEQVGIDYFDKARKRWGLAKKLSQEGKLGQFMFVFEKRLFRDNSLSFKKYSQDKKKEQLNKVRGLVSGFSGFWVVYAGIKSGILKDIVCLKKPATVEDLVNQCKYNKEFAEAWLYAGYSFELLDYSKKKGWQIVPHIKSILLNRDDPYFWGDRIIMHAELCNIYKIFPDRMINGKTESLYKQDLSLIKAIARVTQTDFPAIIEKVIKKKRLLKDRLEAGGNILDIGTGLGYGAVYLSKAFPKARIVGVDKDKRAIQIAKENVKKSNLSGSVSLKALDARGLNLNEKFDFIYMNLVLHEIDSTKKGVCLFLGVCRKLLKKDGFLLINELPFPNRIGECRKPLIKMLMGVQLFETVFGDSLMTFKNIKGLLKETGFNNIEYIKHPNPARLFYLASR
jgi:ubiquinone/menaquinone biosynthesis C-methylase UbiE